MRRLLVLYGLAMTSVVVVAFLVPLGLLARSLAEERALSAGRQDAQSVAVFAGGATQDAARLQAAVLAVNGAQRRTTVFLPVQVEGALFSLGDVHAVMSRGESSFVAIETAGKVTVSLDVVPAAEAGGTGLPWLQTDDEVVFAVLISLFFGAFSDLYQ